MKNEKNDNTLKDLKKEVGMRFKAFRLDLKKAQNVLAAELQVHQSTITNIEHGTTFPKINYLYYFYENYKLNLNWLVTGDGKMYLQPYEKIIAQRIMTSPQDYGDIEYDKYQDLSTMMQIPVIEQVIFAKLSECKILFKDYIKDHYKNLEKEKRKKSKKNSQDKEKK